VNDLYARERVGQSDVGLAGNEVRGWRQITMANAAEFERRLIGERTRLALAAKRARGDRTRRSETPTRIVRWVAAKRDAGWTWQRIADALNASGEPTAVVGQVASEHCPAGAPNRCARRRSRRRTSQAPGTQLGICGRLYAREHRLGSNW